MSSCYKEDLDKIVWSFSTLHGYEQCHYQMYRHKIENEKGISNAFAELGSAIHQTNERIFKKEITIQEALDETVHDFKNCIYSYINEDTLENKYCAACNYYATFDETVFDKYEILEVEGKHEFNVYEYPFIGFIDLLLMDKNNGSLILVDFKSYGHFLKKDGTPLKNQLSNYKAYSKQMYLYCHAIYDKYGEFPKKIVWNHFFDGVNTVIDFNIDNYNEALKWAKYIIEQIYEDCEFIGNKEWFYCNNLCNYRNDCYYKDEEGESDG